MVGLIASIVALAIGPIVYAFIHHSKTKRTWFNGLVVAAIAFAIIDHILGSHSEHIGLPVALAFAVGICLPFIFEQVIYIAQKFSLSDNMSIAQAKTHEIILVFAAIALCFHGITDGIALRSGGTELALAVSLHRLPVGAALWSLIEQNYIRITSFIGIALSTLLGYYFIDVIILDESTLPMIEAFVIGSIIHIIFFSHGH